MARASNGNATTFAGDGAVWFKVYQISAVTDGGTSINWPAYSTSFVMFFKVHSITYWLFQDVAGVTFTVPKSLPSGQYLVRLESIALHAASTFAGGLSSLFLKFPSRG